MTSNTINNMSNIQKYLMCVAFRLMIGLDVISFTLEEKKLILTTTNTKTNMPFNTSSDI